MVLSAHCPTQNTQIGIEHEHQGAEKMTAAQREASGSCRRGSHGGTTARAAACRAASPLLRDGRPANLVRIPKIRARASQILSEWRMGDAHFLIPKLPTGILAIAGVGVSWLASVSFSNTIGLGSIITAAVVVVAAGVFTLRNNLKSFWKELAEERGEQVKILTADLKKAADNLVAAQLRHTEEMASFAEEQREVRHQLKTEIATLEGRLKLEQSKHDLSVVTIRLDKIEETLKGRSATFDELAAAVEGQKTLAA
jgi:hypothetical protein